MTIKLFMENSLPVEARGTDVLFHQTGLNSAIEILQEKQFRLITSRGSRAEREFAGKSEDRYEYYLSTTRSRVGGYHVNLKTMTQAIFVLNGRWFADDKRTRVRPLEYWNDAKQKQTWLQRQEMGHKDAFPEMEDRVYSTVAKLPCNSQTVHSVHVFVPKTETRTRWKKEGWGEELVEEPRPADELVKDLGRIRAVFAAARAAGIKIFLYDNHAAFLVQNPNKRVSFKSYMTGEHKITRRDFLDPAQNEHVRPGEYERIKMQYRADDRERFIFNIFRELLNKKSWSELSKRAKDEIRRLERFSYSPDTIAGVDSSIHNYRKTRHEDYEKLARDLRKNKITSTKQLVEFVVKKWETALKEVYASVEAKLATSVLYHTTDIDKALKTVERGKFLLANKRARSLEHELVGEDNYFSYWFSTARSMLGGFTIGGSRTAIATFRLNGDWFNRNPKMTSKPIDFWTEPGKKRAFIIDRENGIESYPEMEDRILSKESSFPCSAETVTAINVFLPKPRDARYGEHEMIMVRKLILSARERKIPVHVYDDYKAFRLQDRRRAVPLSKYGKPGSIRRNFMDEKQNEQVVHFDEKVSFAAALRELLNKKDRAQLSKEALQLCNQARYQSGRIHVAREWKSIIREEDRRNHAGLARLEQDMRRLRLRTMEALFDFIYNKWNKAREDKAKADHEADLLDFDRRLAEWEAKNGKWNPENHEPIESSVVEARNRLHVQRPRPGPKEFRKPYDDQAEFRQAMEDYSGHHGPLSEIKGAPPIPEWPLNKQQLRAVERHIFQNPAWMAHYTRFGWHSWQRVTCQRHFDKQKMWFTFYEVPRIGHDDRDPENPRTWPDRTMVTIDLNGRVIDRAKSEYDKFYAVLPSAMELLQDYVRDRARFIKANMQYIDKPVYVRYGKWREDERSQNFLASKHAGEPVWERGVSCYHVDLDIEKGHWEIDLSINEDTITGTLESLFYDRSKKIYLVTGKEIGEGSDGEPLLKNVRVLKELDRKEVKVSGVFDDDEDDDAGLVTAAAIEELEFSPTRSAKAYVNPSPSLIAQNIDKMRFGEMRALISKDDGKMWVWEAYRGTHADGAAALGLNANRCVQFMLVRDDDNPEFINVLELWPEEAKQYIPRFWNDKRFRFVDHNDRFVQGTMVEAKVDKIDANDREVPIYSNITPKQIEQILDKSREQRLRIICNTHTGELWVWDAWHCWHETVSNALGINIKAHGVFCAYIERISIAPTDPLTGKLTIYDDEDAYVIGKIVDKQPIKRLWDTGDYYIFMEKSDKWESKNGAVKSKLPAASSSASLAVTAKVDKIEYAGIEVPVHSDLTPSALINLIERSQNKIARFIIDPTTGKMWAWDAYLCWHWTVARAFGIETQKSGFGTITKFNGKYDVAVGLEHGQNGSAAFWIEKSTFKKLWTDSRFRFYDVKTNTFITGATTASMVTAVALEELEFSHARTVRAYVNPSPNVIAQIIGRQRFNEMRAIIDTTNEKMWAWEAYRGTHHDAMRALGLETGQCVQFIFRLDSGDSKIHVEEITPHEARKYITAFWNDKRFAFGPEVTAMNEIQFSDIPVGAVIRFNGIAGNDFADYFGADQRELKGLYVGHGYAYIPKKGKTVVTKIGKVLTVLGVDTKTLARAQSIFEQLNQREAGRRNAAEVERLKVIELVNKAKAAYEKAVALFDRRLRRHGKPMEKHGSTIIIYNGIPSDLQRYLDAVLKEVMKIGYVIDGKLFEDKRGSNHVRGIQLRLPHNPYSRLFVRIVSPDDQFTDVKNMLIELDYDDYRRVLDRANEKMELLSSAPTGTYSAFTVAGATVKRLAVWARKNGIELPSDPLHVTTMYSRKPVPDYKPLTPAAPIRARFSGYDLFDNNTVLVAKLVCPTLDARHRLARKLGATTDFPDYQPHVTLAISKTGFDEHLLDRLPTIDFPVLLDKEYVEPLTP